MAYHFNCGVDSVLEMAHWERKRWCEEISDINEQMNDGTTPTHEADQDGGNFLDADDDAMVLSKSLEDLDGV